MWKDASKAEEAAEKMKLTAKDLYDLKVIDKIIDEPEDNFDILIQNLNNEIVETVDELKKLSKDDIVEDRYRKFRNMGEYFEIGTVPFSKKNRPNFEKRKDENNDTWKKENINNGNKK